MQCNSLVNVGEWSLSLQKKLDIALTLYISSPTSTFREEMTLMFGTIFSLFSSVFLRTEVVVFDAELLDVLELVC